MGQQQQQQWSQRFSWGVTLAFFTLVAVGILILVVRTHHDASSSNSSSYHDFPERNPLCISPTSQHCTGNEECDQVCKLAHPEAHGLCEATTSTCQCHTKCMQSPQFQPIPKNRCMSNIPDICDGSCDSKCCSEMCAIKLPDGRGSCLGVAPVFQFISCVCTYAC